MEWKFPLQGFLLPGMDPGTVIDVEPVMALSVYDPAGLWGDPPFDPEHPEHVWAEEPLQHLQVEPGGNPEQALAAESSVIYCQGFFTSRRRKKRCPDVCKQFPRTVQSVL